MAYYNLINGELVELSEKEVVEIEKKRAAEDYREKTRPLTDSEVLNLFLRSQINHMKVDDTTALRMIRFYPEWEESVAYSVGDKVQHAGKLYRVIQEHTSQGLWQPENSPSLFEGIDETHAGTLTEPIPYNNNMALENGKYYSQNGVTYLCNRDTGNPVYNTLADLVGLYVEEV